VFDVLIVGSGPAGSIAAHQCVQAGLKTAMVDVGFESQEPPAPALPFLQARQLTHQDFFLPSYTSSSKNPGAQLTRQRQHISEGVHTYLPFHSDTFFPLQSLARGGLSVGWGAAAFTYTSAELKRMGLPDLQDHYHQTAALIGISAPPRARLCQLKNSQPPLQLDDNAQTIWQRYLKKAVLFDKKGFHLEPASLAVLSEPLGDRQANSYHDMDFWSDHGNSVFRAQVLVQDLQTKSHFHYFPQHLMLFFQEEGNRVTAHCMNLQDQSRVSLKAKKLILCAGALNSLRIAAHSLKVYEQKTTLLCNPYLYVPMLNLAMVGKKGRDQRHSLAQLFGEFNLNGDDSLTLQFYSYRSLLMYRLIADTPLPIWAGRLLWRAFIESLTIAGVHYPDEPNPAQWVYAQAPETDLLPLLKAHYTPKKLPYKRQILAQLLRLGCVPLGMVETVPGASIHYAGTLPKDAHGPLATDALGRLQNLENVYVFDSATWTSLPSKGLTFTIMANSLRLTDKMIGMMK